MDQRRNVAHLFTRDEHGNLRLLDFDSTTIPWPLTVGELTDLAVARGELGTFDTALPMAWTDDVRAKTGQSAWLLGFVWSYPATSIFGEPFPLTTAARDLLTKYEEVIRG